MWELKPNAYVAGSYNSTFYISGISILTSGLLVIPVADYWTCSCEPRDLDEDASSSVHEHDTDHVDHKNGVQQTCRSTSTKNTNNSDHLMVGRYVPVHRKSMMSETPRTSPTASHSPTLSSSPTRVRFCLTPSPTTTTPATKPKSTAVSTEAETAAEAAPTSTTNDKSPAT